MTDAAHGFQELGWLLDDLVARVSAVRHAVALTDEGLVAGASGGLVREEAEHLAAIAYGMHILAEGAGRRFRTGGVHYTVTEMEEGCLYVASGAATVLAVLTDTQTERELIAYELSRLARRASGRLHTSAAQGG
ncbi:roadblock/LC7 domain-containing protein [Streptomyces sp. ODS28]|uniref:roadblock/LC7 domain-containing protein n=1 Tax=Streptomyces sp. ODS28 TaxID=3136688 RepID=UPI0031EC3CA4